MADSVLVSQWAVCGIAAAAARFVPVPLLDDVIRQRAMQVAVVRTARAHGRRGSSEALQVLWEDEEGRGSGLGRRARAVGRRVLLFPVRKYVALFGAVRGVPNDVMRVVLLARSLDRRLARGDLADPARAPEEAGALRRAVAGAIDGMDLRLLLAAVSDGLSGSRGLTRAAVAFARRRFTRSAPDDELDPDAPVAEGADAVAKALDRPDVAQLLDRFDAEVDALLAAEAAGGR